MFHYLYGWWAAVYCVGLGLCKQQVYRAWQWSSTYIHSSNEVKDHLVDAGTSEQGKDARVAVLRKITDRAIVRGSRIVRNRHGTLAMISRPASRSLQIL